MNDPLTFEPRLIDALARLSEMAPVMDEAHIVDVATEARRSFLGRLFAGAQPATVGQSSLRLGYVLILTGLLIAALVASLVVGSLLSKPFAARNGYIAFSAQSDSQGDYRNLVGADGTPVGRIEGLCPLYSGDGSTMWYMAGDEAHLVVAAPDGTIIREFHEITHQGVHRPEGIALSPDGRQVAWVVNDQIRIQPVDGASVSAVPGGNETPYFPVWSPDGSQIAFKSNRLTTSAEAPDMSDLYVVDVDDSELRLISTRATNDAVGISWSPDGRYIAYIGVPEGATEPADGESLATDVLVVGADGTGERNVTNSPVVEHQVAWSPDGSRLAYLSNADGTSRLASLPMSGGMPVGSSSMGPETGSFAWAPDATKLLWVESVRHGPRDFTSTFHVVDRDFASPSTAIYSTDGSLLCDPSWQRLDPEE